MQSLQAPPKAPRAQDLKLDATGRDNAVSGSPNRQGQTHHSASNLKKAGSITSAL